MEWIFNDDKPIYSQLVEQITKLIVSGEYPPGSKLASVRELALEAAVNPNTMQKALAELENAGLVYTQRTAGRYITDDTDMLEKTRQQLAAEEINKLIVKMRQLGYKKAQVIDLINAIM